MSCPSLWCRIYLPCILHCSLHFTSQPFFHFYLDFSSVFYSSFTALLGPFCAPILWCCSRTLFKRYHPFYSRTVYLSAPSLTLPPLQRTLFLTALILEPDILLLDEPTNNLDTNGIDHLTDLIIATQKTVVVISHDEDFLNAFSDSVLYLDLHSKKVEQYDGTYVRTHVLTFVIVLIFIRCALSRSPLHRNTILHLKAPRLFQIHV